MKVELTRRRAGNSKTNKLNIDGQPKTTAYHQKDVAILKRGKIKDVREH